MDESDFVSFAGGGGGGVGGGGKDEDELQQHDEEHEEIKAPALLTDIPCPWVDLSGFDSSISPFVRFHNEIVDFCKYIDPMEDEMLVRKATFDQIQDCCRKLWPSCRVLYFGSQLTEMLTPASDLDMAILDVPLGDGDVICALESLAEEIKSRGIVSYIEVIASSKVPIIKLDHIPSKISIDICINNGSGEITGKLIKLLKEQFPMLKPLVLVLKVFLSQRKLSETFSGGIGTFVLCNMVVSFILQRQKLAIFRNTGSTYNLGALLIDFFTLYGSTFNYAHTTCTILSGGKYYPKQLLGAEWFNDQRPISLSMESPDETLPQPIDIGKNSWMIAKIRRTFEHAMQVLNCGLQASVLQHQQQMLSKKAPRSYKGVSSFLAYIIRPDDPLLQNRRIKVGIAASKFDFYAVFRAQPKSATQQNAAVAEGDIVLASSVSSSSRNVGGAGSGGGVTSGNSNYNSDDNDDGKGGCEASDKRRKRNDTTDEVAAKSPFAADTASEQSRGDSARKKQKMP